VITVDEIVGLLNYKGQKETYCSVHQISKKRIKQSVASYSSFTACLVRNVFFDYQRACCLLLLVSLAFVFHKVV